jgi:DMSO/TMAO reductase YedYZ molybdopterin-dependent catalytic subunit
MAELTQMPTSNLVATLDCTGGWYSEQRWQGIRVGDLLAQAEVQEGARYVRFRSATGYRWSLPLEEATEALLATGVTDRPLAHGNGAPLRLVAPGRRGFQWVKWVVAVEVLDAPDVGQWGVIFTSGLAG